VQTYGMSYNLQTVSHATASNAIGNFRMKKAPAPNGVGPGLSQCCGPGAGTGAGNTNGTTAAKLSGDNAAAFLTAPFRATSWTPRQ
jgi:hypothetical protein